jgi:hypothetical protein
VHRGPEPAADSRTLPSDDERRPPRVRLRAIGRTAGRGEDAQSGELARSCTISSRMPLQMPSSDLSPL